MTILRTLASGVAALLLALAPAAQAFGSTTAAPEPSPMETSSEDASLIAEITSTNTFTSPDEPLVLRGVLRNEGTAPVDAPSLSLYIDPRNLSSRAAVESWQGSTQTGALLAASGSGDSDENADDDSGIRTPELPAQLGPGEEAGFEFSVPGDDLGLPSQDTSTAWGPRGLTLTATGLVDRVPATSLVPTFTVWYPDPALEPSSLSLLIPFIGWEDAGDGLIPADELEASVAPGGRLAELLTAAEESQASIAVDPLLLASAQAALNNGAGQGEAGGTTPEQEATEEPSEEEQLTHLPEWYERFTALGAERTVLALPWADADPALLTEAGTELRDTADESRDIVTGVFPEARHDVSWPAFGSVEDDTLEEISEGANTLVLSDLQQPSYQSYTASAYSTLPAGALTGRTLETLVVDSQLYGLMAGIAPRDDTETWHGSGAAISALMAQTAAVTAQRPFDQRSLFLPLPREQVDAADDLRVAVEALDEAPWLEDTTLETMLDREPVVRGQLEPGEFTTGSAVQRLEDLRSQATEFNTFLSDREGADRTTDRLLLRCASAGLADPAERSACLDEAATRIDEWTSALQVEEGSPVLLVTGEGTNIPVQIANQGSQPARLTVSLQAQTPQLRTKPSETVEIQPGSSARVEIPVEGIANGDVTAQVILSSVDGTEIRTETGQLVRVRADWENIGTAIAGAGLLTVLVIGLIRTFRRGRRRLPANQLQAAVAQAKQGAAPNRRR